MTTGKYISIKITTKTTNFSKADVSLLCLIIGIDTRRNISAKTDPMPALNISNCIQ